MDNLWILRAITSFALQDANNKTREAFSISATGSQWSENHF